MFAGQGGNNPQVDKFLKQQVDYVKDGGSTNNGNVVRHKILDLEYGPDPTTEKRRSVQSSRTPRTPGNGSMRSQNSPNPCWTTNLLHR